MEVALYRGMTGIIAKNWKKFPSTMLINMDSYTLLKSDRLNVINVWTEYTGFSSMLKITPLNSRTPIEK